MTTSDCLGGAVEHETTELRWALCALQGSYTLHIRSEARDRASRYLGSIRITTVHEVAECGPRSPSWASMEPHCPLFTKNVLAMAPSGRKRSLPLFMFWLHEAMKWKNQFGPDAFEGYVVGQGSYFDNAKILHTLRKTPAFTQANLVGNADRFNLRDPLATDIPKFATQRGLSLRFPRSMIFDANPEHAKVLTALHDVLEHR
jgi:hypothetical protein